MNSFEESLDELHSHLELVGSMWGVWSELNAASNEKAKMDALNSFGSFFATTMEACLLAVCVGLYRLHDKRRDVLSISRIGADAFANELAQTSLPPDVSELVGRAEPLVDKVAVLRHKVFAHRDHQLSSDGAFLTAQLRPSDISDLVALTRAILNEYSMWSAKTTWTPSEHAAAATRDLVNGLLRS